MDTRNLITYCGLFCDLCAQRSRIPERAKELIEAMEEEGYQHWGKEIPGFNEFWSFAQNIASVSDERCCKSGKCGAPFCTIRKCAQEKNLETCDQCEAFPCKRIDGIAKGYPTLLYDAERRKAIGVEEWLEEQAARKQKGFQYADIRCYPYEVPSE